MIPPFVRLVFLITQVVAAEVIGNLRAQAPITFRSQMFCIEDILEVLVRVQRAICEQITLRALSIILDSTLWLLRSKPILVIFYHLSVQ